jgi:hypothetical protein
MQARCSTLENILQSLIPSLESLIKPQFQALFPRITRFCQTPGIVAIRAPF